MMRVLRPNHITALDCAALVFLLSVLSVWIMGGSVGLESMAGGAIGGLVCGAALRWQVKR